MEGAFRVWLRGSQVTYFTLKGQAQPKRPKHSNHDIDDLSQIKIWTHGEVSLLFEILLSKNSAGASHPWHPC